MPAEAIQYYLFDIGISDWKDIEFKRIASGIPNLGEMMTKIIADEDVSPHRINEINYLAIKTQEMSEDELAVFTANIEDFAIASISANVADSACLMASFLLKLSNCFSFFSTFLSRPIEVCCLLEITAAKSSTIACCSVRIGLWVLVVLMYVLMLVLVYQFSE